MPHPSPAVLLTTRPGRRARAACGTVKVAVVAVLAGVYLTSGPGWSSSGSAGESFAPGPQPPAPVQQLLQRHDCSLTGYSGQQVPTSAIVRSAAGRLHFVDFDTAWRVFTRHGAATLVAVCLDDPPPTRRSSSE